MANLKIYSAITHQGPVRPVNEDRYGVSPHFGVFGVFDGLGGGGVGDVASEYVSSQVGAFFNRASGDSEATLPFVVRPQYLLETNFAMNALLLAHEALLKENRSRKINSKASVSALVVCHAGSILSFVGSGNCLALRLRRGKLKELLQRDSYLSFATEPDRAVFRDIPLTGIGFEVEPLLHVEETRIREGDSYWLLSGGLESFLEEGDFRDAMDKAKESPQAVVQYCVDLATRRGCTDNQTVLYLQF